MEWLNYHHLLYFWMVVREGSVSRAAEELRLAQPTVSAQIKQLEEALGEALFERHGRRLVLTEVGRVVHRHADEIFGIGQELLDTLKGRARGTRPMLLTVGVANAVPKPIVHRLLAPALGGDSPVHLVCREDSPDALLAGLATHALDVVIADTPAPPHVRVKVFNHLLGESAVSCFAAATLASKLRRRFPASLDGAPMLLPTTQTSLRRSLEQWFAAESIEPRIVGEFDDPALMKAFGEEGVGVFAAPAAIARDVMRQYRVRPVGRCQRVRERYYAISAERRLTHPGVLAITAAARTQLLD